MLAKKISLKGYSAKMQLALIGSSFLSFTKLNTSIKLEEKSLVISTKTGKDFQKVKDELDQMMKYMTSVLQFRKEEQLEQKIEDLAINLEDLRPLNEQNYFIYTRNSILKKIKELKFSDEKKLSLLQAMDKMKNEIALNKEESFILFIFYNPNKQSNLDNLQNILKQIIDEKALAQFNPASFSLHDISKQSRIEECQELQQYANIHNESLFDSQKKQMSKQREDSSLPSKPQIPVKKFSSSSKKQNNDNYSESSEENSSSSEEDSQAISKNILVFSSSAENKHYQTQIGHSDSSSMQSHSKVINETMKGNETSKDEKDTNVALKLQKQIKETKIKKLAKDFIKESPLEEQEDRFQKGKYTKRDQVEHFNIEDCQKDENNNSDDDIYNLEQQVINKARELNKSQLNNQKNTQSSSQSQRQKKSDDSDNEINSNPYQKNNQRNSRSNSREQDGEQCINNHYQSNYQRRQRSSSKEQESEQNMNNQYQTNYQRNQRSNSREQVQEQSNINPYKRRDSRLEEEEEQQKNNNPYQVNNQRGQRSNSRQEQDNEEQNSRNQRGRYQQNREQDNQNTYQHNNQRNNSRSELNSNQKYKSNYRDSSKNEGNYQKEDKSKENTFSNKNSDHQKSSNLKSSSASEKQYSKREGLRKDADETLQEEELQLLLQQALKSSSVVKNPVNEEDQIMQKDKGYDYQKDVEIPSSKDSKRSNQIKEAERKPPLYSKDIKSSEGQERVYKRREENEDDGNSNQPQTSTRGNRQGPSSNQQEKPQQQKNNYKQRDSYQNKKDYNTQEEGRNFTKKQYQKSYETQSNSDSKKENSENQQEITKQVEDQVAGFSYNSKRLQYFEVEPSKKEETNQRPSRNYDERKENNQYSKNSYQNAAPQQNSQERGGNQYQRQSSESETQQQGQQTRGNRGNRGTQQNQNFNEYNNKDRYQKSSYQHKNQDDCNQNIEKKEEEIPDNSQKQPQNFFLDTSQMDTTFVAVNEKRLQQIDNPSRNYHEKNYQNHNHNNNYRSPSKKHYDNNNNNFKNQRSSSKSNSNNNDFKNSGSYRRDNSRSKSRKPYQDQKEKPHYIRPFGNNEDKESSPPKQQEQTRGNYQDKYKRDNKDNYNRGKTDNYTRGNKDNQIKGNQDGYSRGNQESIAEDNQDNNNSQQNKRTYTKRGQRDTEEDPQPNYQRGSRDNQNADTEQDTKPNYQSQRDNHNVEEQKTGNVKRGNRDNLPITPQENQNKYKRDNNNNYHNNNNNNINNSNENQGYKHRGYRDHNDEEGNKNYKSNYQGNHKYNNNQNEERPDNQWTKNDQNSKDGNQYQSNYNTRNNNNYNNSNNNNNNYNNKKDNYKNNYNNSNRNYNNDYKNNNDNDTIDNNNNNNRVYKREYKGNNQQEYDGEGDKQQKQRQQNNNFNTLNQFEEQKYFQNTKDLQKINSNFKQFISFALVYKDPIKANCNTKDGLTFQQREEDDQELQFEVFIKQKNDNDALRIFEQIILNNTLIPISEVHLKHLPKLFFHSEQAVYQHIFEQLKHNKKTFFTAEEIEKRLLKVCDDHKFSKQVTSMLQDVKFYVIIHENNGNQKEITQGMLKEIGNLAEILQEGITESHLTYPAMTQSNNIQEYLDKWNNSQQSNFISLIVQYLSKPKFLFKLHSLSFYKRDLTILTEYKKYIERFLNAYGFLELPISQKDVALNITRNFSSQHMEYLRFEIFLCEKHKMILSINDKSDRDKQDFYKLISKRKVKFNSSTTNESSADYVIISFKCLQNKVPLIIKELKLMFDNFEQTEINLPLAVNTGTPIDQAQDKLLKRMIEKLITSEVKRFISYLKIKGISFTIVINNLKEVLVNLIGVKLQQDIVKIILSQIQNTMKRIKILNCRFKQKDVELSLEILNPISQNILIDEQNEEEDNMNNQSVVSDDSSLNNPCKNILSQMNKQETKSSAKNQNFTSFLQKYNVGIYNQLETQTEGCCLIGLSSDCESAFFFLKSIMNPCFFYKKSWKKSFDSGFDFNLVFERILPNYLKRNFHLPIQYQGFGINILQENNMFIYYSDHVSDFKTEFNERFNKELTKIVIFEMVVKSNSQYSKLQKHESQDELYEKFKTIFTLPSTFTKNCKATFKFLDNETQIRCNQYIQKYFN